MIMRVYRIRKRQDSIAAIKAAVVVLRQGGIIAFPTETVYGLGCDATSAVAARRVYHMKQRERNKTLQLIAGSLAQVKAVSKLGYWERMLVSRYWPGPLTLLVSVRPEAHVSSFAIQDGRIGIRVTSDPFLQKLLRVYGKPIAATSANRSGETPARSGREVMKIFQARTGPDLLIDMGRLLKRQPSTVASTDSSGRVSVLRQGSVRLPKRVSSEEKKTRRRGRIS